MLSSLGTWCYKSGNLIGNNDINIVSLGVWLYDLFYEARTNKIASYFNQESFECL